MEQNQARQGPKFRFGDLVNIDLSGLTNSANKANSVVLFFEPLKDYKDGEVISCRFNSSGQFEYKVLWSTHTTIEENIFNSNSMPWFPEYILTLKEKLS